VSVPNTKKPSRTDWAKLAEMTDEAIDTSDIPELDDEFFSQATMRLPKDALTAIELDPNV